MRLCKHGKKPSIAFIKYFWKIVRQMKENAVYLLLDRNRFSWYALIFLTIKTRTWQHITNQNSCDVTTVFTYSHLNTPLDQWEHAYYPNPKNNKSYRSQGPLKLEVLESYKVTPQLWHALKLWKSEDNPVLEEIYGCLQFFSVSHSANFLVYM